MSSTAVLQLMQVKGLGAKTLTKILNLLAQQERTLDQLVDLPPEVLTKIYGLKPEMAHSIVMTRNKAESLLEELEREKIKILIRGYDHYPTQLIEVLGNDAPPILFAKGNLEILSKKGVGFCGSRKASEKGLRVGNDCAQLLAEQNLNIVSGYAHGVDIAAHKAAMSTHNGATTLVLAEGILEFRKKREIASLFTQQNYLALSEFPPHLPWSVSNAMQRNRTICGLSTAMIIIETGLSGGTFAAGEAALQLRRPLFVVEYAHPAVSAEGNAYFLQKGATALRGNEKGTPNVKPLLQVLQTSDDVSNTQLLDLTQVG